MTKLSVLMLYFLILQIILLYIFNDHTFLQNPY
jgi:hypothetical protein